MLLGLIFGGVVFAIAIYCLIAGLVWQHRRQKEIKTADAYRIAQIVAQHYGSTGNSRDSWYVPQYRRNARWHTLRDIFGQLCVADSAADALENLREWDVNIPDDIPVVQWKGSPYQ